MSGEELDVTTGHLCDLSTNQSDAVQQIGAAGVHGVSMSMWVNHGVICAATNSAVSAAEAARDAACQTMQFRSTRLSEQLLDAADMYDSTDQQQNENLDGTMRSGIS